MAVEFVYISFFVRLIVYFPLLVILAYFNLFDPYSFEYRILA